MSSRVVAVFDRREDAVKARQDLIQAGCKETNVQLTAQAAGAKPAEADKGFWESLKEFFGADDSTTYQEAYRRGGTVLTVDTAEGQTDQVVAILNRHNPADIDRRVEEWTRAGWQRPATATAAASTSTATGASARKGEVAVPKVEEQLNVGKRREERGGVRIYKRVIEQPVQEQVRLREEHVHVEERPANRPAGPEAFKEQTIEAREMRERPVVSKEARVVGEVVVGKEATEHTETVKDTVRRTDVQVEQLDDEFRRDFDSHYAGRGVSYDQWRPAYQYGQQMAMDKRYSGRDWTAVESDARTHFEKTHPGKWGEFKDAVRRAYEKARAKVHA
jgi:uncharacterized protein (TIGR02271 family)